MVLARAPARRSVVDALERYRCRWAVLARVLVQCGVTDARGRCGCGWVILVPGPVPMQCGDIDSPERRWCWCAVLVRVRCRCNAVP